MGGNAFISGDDPLWTPRMPPAVYQHIRNKCHTALRQRFIATTTPIEGPGKKDFGDLDVFVLWDKLKFSPASFSDDGDAAAASLKDPWEACKVLLGAHRSITPAAGSRIYAIPWPTDLPKGIDAEMEVEDEAKPRYIQVDVHICESQQKFDWFLFKHAHGDLWNLLGSTIRPFGLTVDEVGLYLRIPEIEKIDKKKAKVFLTSDPDEVLDFIGLESGQEWSEPFESMEAIFEYAATCRLFWVKPLSSDSDVSGDEQVVGGEFRKEKLKSNDRKRMNQRPMFRKWIDEFLPKCREERRFKDRPINKDQIRQEAFDYFQVQGVYELQLLDWQKKRQRDTLWKEVIKTAIPTEGIEPNLRSCCASAFKKIVLQDDESWGIKPPSSIKDRNGLFNVDEVRRFVETRWKEVGEAAWTSNKKRFLENLAKKGVKRTASGSEKEPEQAAEGAGEATEKAAERKSEAIEPTTEKRCEVTEEVSTA